VDFQNNLKLVLIIFYQQLKLEVEYKEGQELYKNQSEREAYKSQEDYNKDQREVYKNQEDYKDQMEVYEDKEHYKNQDQEGYKNQREVQES
jgi:hypothetical protein